MRTHDHHHHIAQHDAADHDGCHEQHHHRPMHQPAHGPAEHGCQHGPAEHGCQHGPNQHRPAQQGPTQHLPAGRGCQHRDAARTEHGSHGDRRPRAHRHDGTGAGAQRHRHGRGRMDERILRTARRIRRASSGHDARAIERTLAASVSHADFRTTMRTLRAFSRALRDG